MGICRLSLADQTFAGRVTNFELHRDAARDRILGAIFATNNRFVREGVTGAVDSPIRVRMDHICAAFVVEAIVASSKRLVVPTDRACQATSFIRSRIGADRQCQGLDLLSILRGRGAYASLSAPTDSSPPNP